MIAGMFWRTVFNDFLFSLLDIWVNMSSCGSDMGLKFTRTDLTWVLWLIAVVTTLYWTLTWASSSWTLITSWTFTSIVSISKFKLRLHIFFVISISRYLHWIDLPSTTFISTVIFVWWIVACDCAWSVSKVSEWAHDFLHADFTVATLTCVMWWAYLMIFLLLTHKLWNILDSSVV